MKCREALLLGASRSLGGGLRAQTRAGWLAVALLLLIPVTSGVAQEKTVDPRHAEFLEIAGPLLTKKVRREFLTLDEGYQRDDYIEAFWLALDPDPGTSRNEFREAWTARWEIAAEEFGEDVNQRPRALAFLTQGEPQIRVENPCESLFWPVEIWVWTRNPRFGRVVAVFVDRGSSGRYQMWSALDDPQALSMRTIRDIPREDWVEVLRWLDRPVNATVPDGRRSGSPGLTDIDGLMTDGERLYGLFDEMRQECPSEVDAANMLLEAISQRVTKPNAEILLLAPAEDIRTTEGSQRWLEDWRGRSTDLPEGGESFEAELQLDFPGRRMSQTIVDGTVLVPRPEPRTAAEGEPVVHRYELNGEVLREGTLHESFRYRFELHDEEIEGDLLPLVFRRFLRPGEYVLRLRMEEHESGRYFRSETDLTVPKRELAEAEPGDAEGLAAARADLESSAARITLEVPEAEVYTGYQRFDATVDGVGVSKVAFFVDGKEMMRRSRAPWTAELPMGDVPRPRVVEVVALAEDGSELGRDRVELNQGRHRFLVSVVEPDDGAVLSGKTLLRASVQVPADQTLERVELYRDEQNLATLYQEPWELTVELDGRPGLLRAVAFLADGNSTEDVVLVNVPGSTERVRVHLVELSVAAETSGRPVLDLEAGQIAVTDDGQARDLLRFEPVKDLPLHLMVLLDTSGSMQDRIDEMRDVALRFFEKTVSPRDRVSVVTFHEQQQMRVDFTSDFEEMKKGLRYISVGQGTAFYDALLYGLYHFRGITGQRALLLLSDGKDVDSKTSFDEVLEYARQAGVTIYPIGLKGLKRSYQDGSKLEKLAEETGGRSWFVKDVAELEGVYQRIEQELRSRYLVAYQVMVEEGSGFRPVRVTTTRSGVEIKAPAGYYP